MSSTTELAPISPLQMPEAVSTRVQAAPDVYGTIHRALRGRYWLAILLGLVGFGLGGWGGWKLQKPTYRSEGLIRIANTLPQVMQETDQNRPMAMYDTFMQSQKLLIASRRIVGNAMEDAIWKTGKLVPPTAQYIAEHLAVEVQPKSEYIQVSMTDQDPIVAAAAVTSIINAYYAEYKRQESLLESSRIGVLVDRQDSLQSSINQTRTKIEKIAKEFGTEKLDIFYDAAAQRVTRLETALIDIRTAIATAPAQASEPDVKIEGATNVIASIDEIAAVDPVMRSYLDEQRRMEDALDHMLLRGLGEAHKDIIYARQSLDKFKSRVNQYADKYRSMAAVTGLNPSVGTGQITLTGRSLASLRANEASLQKLLTEARQEMVALGSKQLDLDRLRSDLEAVRTELSQLNRRKETLQAEERLGGRLSIIGTGEVPITPEKDGRIKMAAAAGAVGAGLPVGLLFLLGLTSRKVRHSDETSAKFASNAPLLGILPMLKESLVDAEEIMAVAHCVHQIRVTLNAQSRGEKSRTYLMTSAVSGEGKTSLTMALGMSFAATGRRTLVVDCDWIGRGLSRKLHLEGKQGIYEALAAGETGPFIHKTFGGLHVLPTGQVEMFEACAISATAIRTLLDEARRLFDIIIIDTGPVLGSVEALELAQAVDSVILTIARGQRRYLVEQAVQRLASLRVRIAGFVFNQANGHDFRRSGYSSTSRMSSHYHDVSIPRPSNLEGFADLGPLVKAVASQLPEEPAVDDIVTDSANVQAD